MGGEEIKWSEDVRRYLLPDAGEPVNGKCSRCGRIWDEVHQKRRDVILAMIENPAAHMQESHPVHDRWTEPITNATERPEDTVRRYARQLLDLQEGMEAEGVDLSKTVQDQLVAVALGQIRYWKAAAEEARRKVASYEMTKAGNKSPGPVISGMEISIPEHQRIDAWSLESRYRPGVERNSGEII